MSLKKFRYSVLLGAALIVGAGTQVSAQDRTHDASTTSATTDEGFIEKSIKDAKMEVEMAEMALEKSDNENVKAVAEELKKDHSALIQSLSRLDGASDNADGDRENDSMTNKDEVTNNDDITSNSAEADAAQSNPEDTGTASNQLDIAGTKTTKDLDSAGNDTDPATTDHQAATEHAATEHNMTAAADAHAVLVNADGEQFDSLWVNHMLIKHKIKLGELHQARKSVNDPELKEIVANAIPDVRNHRDMLTDLQNNPDEPVKIRGKNKEYKSERSAMRTKSRS